MRDQQSHKDGEYRDCVSTDRPFLTIFETKIGARHEPFHP